MVVVTSIICLWLCRKSFYSPFRNPPFSVYQNLAAKERRFWYNFEKAKNRGRKNRLRRIVSDQDALQNGRIIKVPV